MKTQRHTKLPELVGPNAPDIERSVLGAMLIDKQSPSLVMGLLDESSFADLTRQKVFRAMQSLFEKEEPIDAVTVVDEMRKNGNLDPVNDPVFVTELTMDITSSANIEYHSRILLEYKTLRSIVRMAANAQRLAHSGEDIFDIVEKLRAEIDGFSSGLSTGNTHSISESVEIAKELLANIHLDPDALGVINFGLRDLDQTTGGCLPGNLIVIGGKRKSGKTSLMLNALVHNARKEKAVGIFSLEMSEGELALRQAFIEAQVDFTKVFRNALTEFETTKLKNTFAAISHLPIYVNDRVQHLGEIVSETTSMKRKHDIKMVVVDYLQLIATTVRDDDSREQQVAMISRTLKRLAKKLQLVVCALTQLNEFNKSRESRSIEADADKLIYLDPHEDDEILCGEFGRLVDVKVVQRFGVSGKFGDFQLMFDKRYGAFENYSPLDAPLNNSQTIKEELPF